MSAESNTNGALRLVPYPENARYFVVHESGEVVGTVYLGSIRKLSAFEVGQAHLAGLEVSDKARREDAS